MKQKNSAVDDRMSRSIIRELCGNDSVEQVSRLISQLTRRSVVPDIASMVMDPSCHVIVIECDGELLGLSSIVFYRTPTRGLTGRIEDVVVDEKMRGSGYGRKMLEALLDEARIRKTVCVQLVSEPERATARALYDSLGFTLRETGEFTHWL